MDDAQPSTINTWTSEENIVFPNLDTFLNVVDTMKPCNIQKHLTVPEMSCQPMLAPLSCFLKTEKLPQDLYERHIGGQFADLV